MRSCSPRSSSRARWGSIYSKCRRHREPRPRASKRHATTRPLPGCGWPRACAAGSHGQRYNQAVRKPRGVPVRRARSVLVFLILVAAGASATALAARYDGARAHSVTTIKATEVEWGIKTSTKAGHAGKISFAVRNTGKLTHQFIVLRTNLPAARQQAARARNDGQPEQGRQSARHDQPCPRQERTPIADLESRALRPALQPCRPLPIRATRRLPSEVTRLRPIPNTRPETASEGASSCPQLSRFRGNCDTLSLVPRPVRGSAVDARGARKNAEACAAPVGRTCQGGVGIQQRA
jgi:hypothetical protein